VLAEAKEKVEFVKYSGCKYCWGPESICNLCLERPLIVEEGVFTRVKATAFLLGYSFVVTARMDPQGSHIGVRMNDKNQNG